MKCPSSLERAFELARGGKYPSIDQIKQKLKSEAQPRSDRWACAETTTTRRTCSCSSHPTAVQCSSEQFGKTRERELRPGNESAQLIAIFELLASRQNFRSTGLGGQFVGGPK